MSNQKLDIKSFGLIDINNKSIKELLEKKDFELNSLNYEEALYSDKRTYCEYYISLLKNNHPLVFAFSLSISLNTTQASLVVSKSFLSPK